jgi:hypothetical protein
MPDSVFILFMATFGVVGVLGIVLSILNYRAGKAREQALMQWAVANGWTFDYLRDDDHDSQFPQFGVFQQGHSRAAYNTIQGTVSIGGRGFPLRCGDYEYKVTITTGKTTTTSTHRFSYIILSLPFQGVPGLVIRRENLLDKIAGAFGFGDIDFESAAFSKRFFVKSPDKKFAYDVITPQMMDFLMSGDPPPIDIDGGQICLTDGHGCWEPERFQQELSWAEQFFGLWPEFLMDQFGGATSQSYTSDKTGG